MIKTKQDMYALYDKCCFGNKLITWKNLYEYYDSNFESPVVMRYKGSSGGGFAQYEVPKSEIENIVQEWVKKGANKNLITLNEAAPDHLIKIQGEIMRSTSYISIRYSTLPLPMRKALETKQYHENGIIALNTLKRNLDATSYDNIWRLLDLYEDAVIEFSTWDCVVGHLKNNTVIWEVRNY